MQLTICVGASSLRSMSSCTSSSVAARISSASFAFTVMAPRSARSFTAGDCVSRASGSGRGGVGRLGGPPGPPQALDLRRRQAPALARLEAPQPERAERHALELDHPVADGLEHAPHLALASLAERDLDHPGLRLARTGGRRAAVLQLDAPRSAASARREPGRLHPRPVDLPDPVARMGEQLGELAVVGEQDQPGAVRVEAPDRVEPPPRAHELDHGRPPVRVARGRDHAGRLVERMDLARLGLTGRPSAAHATRLVDVARRVRTTSRPTVTRPSAIRPSAARREATPAWARNLARRTAAALAGRLTASSARAQMAPAARGARCPCRRTSPRRRR